MSADTPAVMLTGPADVDITYDAICMLAVSAALQLERATSDVARGPLRLRCAALGALLLAELGAQSLSSYVGGDHFAGVMIRGDEDDAELRRHAPLLRRLGWRVPDERRHWLLVRYAEP